MDPFQGTPPSEDIRSLLRMILRFRERVYMSLPEMAVELPFLLLISFSKI